MVISDLLSRVVILVFPGIVCNLVYGILKNKQTRKDWEDFLQILVFSVISYSIYGFILSLNNYRLQGSFHFDTSLLNAFLHVSNINWLIILKVTGIGALLGIVAAYFYKYRILTRLGIRIGATKIYSDEDVWTDFFDIADDKWIIVRDLKQDLTYLGWAKHYSVSEKERELLLSDVSVYNGTTEDLEQEIFSRKYIYLSRPKHELSLEFKKTDDKNTDKLENQ